MGVNVPGYKVLIGEEGPIYLPNTDKKGLIKAISMCPQMGWGLGKIIIQVVSDRHTIGRIQKDPLFSMIYGCLVSMKFEDSDDLRKLSEWVRTELSRVKLS